jgi:hypothetical protein
MESELQDRKVLLRYKNNIDEKNLKLLEFHMDKANEIEYNSRTFSQFLFSGVAALLAIFFSVENFNNLVVNQTAFNWSILIYSIFFFTFIFYSKERIDKDSSDLSESNLKADRSFKEAEDVLSRQLEKGIDMNTFYKEVETLYELNKATKSKKETPNYFLEMLLFGLAMSLWLLIYSTQSWSIIYLYLGSVIIFYVTNNQNRHFIKIVNGYSRLMSKISPVQSNKDL